MTDSGAELWRMIRGYWVSQIVGTVAQLGIADHLADGPLECAVLAVGSFPEADLYILKSIVHGLPEKPDFSPAAPPLAGLCFRKRPCES